MKKTLSVFIPAYNEDKNIKQLLRSILNQKGDFTLEKILIISDASTDDTVSEAHSLNNPLIEVIENKKRMGKWFGFTIAQKKLLSNVIISLDADIAISDCFLFEKISKELVHQDIVSVRQLPTETNSYFQKIIKIGANISNTYNEKTENNIYLCNGRCIGVTKELFMHFVWKATYGTDIYMYLQAIRLQKKFKYISTSEIYYKLPKTILDYISQSSRASAVPKLMEKNLDLVYQEYTKPFLKKKFFVITLISLKNDFLTSFLYIILYLITRPLCLFKRQKTLWKIAKSTK